jgi:general secretion pathway protein H
MGRTRTSARPRRTTAGFTLVEMMVVLMIVGLLAAAAVLAMPEPGGGLRVEAETFAARAKAAQETALIDSRSTSLLVGPAGYAIARSRDGAWQEMARFDWQDGTRPDLAAGQQMRTIFDSTGTADPLELTLRRGDRRVTIEIGGDGEIQIQR